MLKQCTDNNGYLAVTFGRKQMSVHILIAKAFIDNPDPTVNIFVNHKDGGKLNNYVVNLEWVTPAGNSQHAMDHGLRSNTRRVVQTHADGSQTIHATVSSAARALNMHKGTVLRALTGKTKRVIPNFKLLSDTTASI